MRANSHLIPTPYADIAVWDSGGDGYPLLLLHGSGSSRGAFARQFDSATLRQFRLLALDLPGHGQSTDATDSQGYALPALADAVAAVLHNLVIRQVAMFGWSLGGHVAIELLARGSLVRGLMLTGTPPLARGPLGMLRGFRPSWDMLLGSKPDFTARDAQRYLSMCYGADDPDHEAHLGVLLRADGRLRQMFSRSMMRGDGADQRRTVETADIPIAIVNGADDPVVRQSYLEGLSVRHLWTGQCQIIAGAGHSPFWSHPKLFNALLARFVEDVAAFEPGCQHAQGARGLIKVLVIGAGVVLDQLQAKPGASTRRG